MSLIDEGFGYGKAELADVVSKALDLARQFGATDAAVRVSESDGMHVKVRNGDITERLFDGRKSITLTVYRGLRSAHVTSSDFSIDVLRKLARTANDLSVVTAEDPSAALADVDIYAGDTVELDLYHPWRPDPAEAIELARAAEGAAFAAGSAITNSEGASIHTFHGQFMFGTTRGFQRGYATSAHSVTCAPLATNGKEKRLGFWADRARCPDDLASPAVIGARAAKRALSRLHARQVETCRCPVLFDAVSATSLLADFIDAASGKNLYQSTSFLVGQLGEQIFATHIDIAEEPFKPRGNASAPFDQDGIAGSSRSLVDAGKLEGYLLGLYAARRLGMKPTGNGSGPYNVTLSSRNTGSGDDFAEMVRKLDRGLIVMGMVGNGSNLLTGDFSRGCYGFWVEHGAIQFPVDGVVVAGNLKQMFRDVCAVGCDTHLEGNFTTGSWLVPNMTVSGA